MKLPIVSRKKYEILKQNNKVLNETKMQSANKCIELQKDVIKYVEINRDLGNELDVITEKLKEKKKEISNLKRLLTKNGISYKKENK